jgi:hypothetical protein
MRFEGKWTAHKTYIPKFPDLQNSTNYRHFTARFPKWRPSEIAVFSRLRSRFSTFFKISFEGW